MDHKIQGTSVANLARFPEVFERTLPRLQQYCTCELPPSSISVHQCDLGSILDLLHTIMVATANYMYFVSNFGDNGVTDHAFW